MRPEVYAKSALKEDDLESKRILGGDGIEIQLITELVNGAVGKYFYAKDVYDLSLLKKYNIKAVHAPLLGNYGIPDVNIESLCDSSDFLLLDQVCYIANLAGEYHDRTILVVIHSESCRNNMMLIGDTWKRVINCVGCLLFKYPRIEICIENVTPLRNVGKRLHLCNNFYLDNVEVVKELRKQLHTDRIGTVLDVCHAEITNSVYKAIYGVFAENLNGDDYSMPIFFEGNKDVCKLIHLSNTIGTGYGRSRHGQPFSDETYPMMQYYLDLYREYEYTCPITLEVAENDYLNCLGYKESLRLYNKYFSN